jgi:hypothetical protein
MVEVLKSKASASGLEKARTALMWINSANEFKPFTLGELWDALATCVRVANRPEAGAPSQSSLTSNRIPIGSWNHLKSILEKLCGSFVEIRSHHGQISGESHVQLVHQTAKDFLKYSPTAGPLAFTDGECLTEVQIGCVSYIQMIFEPHFSSFTSPSRDVVTDWQDHLARVASSLEEYRLLRLCLLVMENNPKLLENLQIQKEMVRNCFLPPTRTSLPPHHQRVLVSNWIYDYHEFEHHPLLSSGFGYLFHFATTRGFRQAAQNILSLGDICGKDCVQHMFRSSIVHGILFTVLDDINISRQYKMWIVLPYGGGATAGGAVMAMDNLYRPIEGEMLKFSTQSSEKEATVREVLRSLGFKPDSGSGGLYSRLVGGLAR